MYNIVNYIRLISFVNGMCVCFVTPPASGATASVDGASSRVSKGGSASNQT